MKKQGSKETQFMNIFCSCLRPISSMHSENAIFKTVTWWEPPVSFHVLSHFHVMSFHESWRFMYWVILSWWYFLVMSFHGSWRFMYRVIFSWCHFLVMPLLIMRRFHRCRPMAVSRRLVALRRFTFSLTYKGI